MTDERQDHICPFCKESEFDLIGLKMHFEKGWCEIYNSTSTRGV